GDLHAALCFIRRGRRGQSHAAAAARGGRSDAGDRVLLRAVRGTVAEPPGHVEHALGIAVALAGANAEVAAAMAGERAHGTAVDASVAEPLRELGGRGGVAGREVA